MLTDTTTPSAPAAQRRDWMPPRLTRLAPHRAEAAANPVTAEGPIGEGS